MRFAAVSILGVLLAQPSFAYDGPDFIGSQQEVVLEAVKAMRANITDLRIADGSFLPPETDEELKSPIIPYEDAKRAVNRGILSGLAEYCGLDWKSKSFESLMKQERARKKWSQKQLAFIGGLHGFMQGQMTGVSKGKGPCPKQQRAQTQTVIENLN